MTLEEFLATNAAILGAHPNWDAFRRALEQSTVSAPSASPAAEASLKKRQPELIRYLRIEDHDAAGRAPAAVRWWRSARLLDTDWAMWRYASPNNAAPMAGVIEAWGGNRCLTLVPLAEGLDEPRLAVWAIAHVLAQSGAIITGDAGRWRLTTLFEQRLARLADEPADWTAAAGLPDLAALRERDGIDPFATRSELDAYRRKLAWELQLFGGLCTSVPSADADNPFSAEAIARAVREQNTFTLPAGVDGNLDQAPGRPPAGFGPQARLIRTGRIGPSIFWLFAFTDKLGNDVYLTAQRTPADLEEMNRLRTWPGYAGLSPDQVLLLAFARSLELSRIVLVEGNDLRGSRARHD